MTIDARFSADKTVYTISIDGDFNFSCLNEFRDAYSDSEVKSAKIMIDMRSTATIDSSALGMLLNMQRFLNSPNGDISIVNCNKVVEKIFNITHFEKKFHIS